MSWWNRRPGETQHGSVLFRGRWVARPEDFAFLEKRGIRVGSPSRREDGGWSAGLEHPRWGRATLLSDPGLPLPPPALVELDPRLYDDERAVVASCGWAVAVGVEPRTGNVLSDRKDLLRFLHAVLGEEGIAVADHAAQALWSRAGLEQELAHDADLDIDAIYTLHLVHDPGSEPAGEAGGDPRSYWLHTHGLRGLGFSEFDVLDPDAGLGGHAHDLLRALAFATVEGELGVGAAPFRLAGREAVRAVPAREVLARTPAREHAEWRANVDDEHLDGHVVICDPAPRGLLSRLLRGAAPRASRFLRGPLPDEVLIHFSNSATELMATRARGTLSLLRGLVEELAELEPVALVKLGYVVDGGSDGEREHLWFRVHGFQGDAVDATLVNAPFHVARMREGDRATHPLELLSDWAMLTPVGRIDPRQTRTLRFIRENREKLREIAAAARAETAPT